MRIVRRTGVACSLAAISLVAFATGASANRSLSIEARSPYSYTGVLTATFNGIEIFCSFTLRSELRRSLVPKSVARRLPEAIIGQINEATRVPRCRDIFGGEETGFILLIGAGFPVSQRYDAFLGTLPSVTGIAFTWLSLEIRPPEISPGMECLYQADVSALASETGGRGSFNRIAFEAPRMPLKSGSFACQRTMELRGSLTIEPTLRVRLL